MSEAPHPDAVVRPGRTITGMSATLLPYTDDGGIDWPGFAAHVERTAAAGLTPAVNMDTGYVQLLDEATRLRVLDATTAVCGDDFVAGARKAVTKMLPTMKDNPDYTSIINDRHYDRITGYIEDAKAKGASVPLGGRYWDNFVEPTVLTNVNASMNIWNDETFGPVVAVSPFRTEEEAVALNNDTEYGLTAAIWTADEARALRLGARLETGMVHVNDQNINDEPVVPFGGVKASGVGRYGGRWSLDAFTELRWITLERGGRHYPPGF